MTSRKLIVSRSRYSQAIAVRMEKYGLLRIAMPLVLLLVVLLATVPGLSYQTLEFPVKAQKIAARHV